MMATIAFLKEAVRQLPPVSDWIYLNNFISSHRPLPFRLPSGMGCQLKSEMEELITSIHEIFNKTFAGPTFMGKVNALTSALEVEVRNNIDKVQKFANSKGLNIESSPEEFTISPMESIGKKKSSAVKTYDQKDIQKIREQIGEITTNAHLSGRELSKKIECLKREEAEKILAVLIKPLTKKFLAYLGDWINELQKDILDHIDDFLVDIEEINWIERIADRYAVNLLVDNRSNSYPSVIIDPSPTYESLFGSIKYRAGPNGYMTDFTMIRAGNLHRANGGILVLRAEALAMNGDLWNAIKNALRDKVIRIEERHRENSLPLLDAPEPKSIPLDVQIVIVGAPIWYYTFFFNDPDFRTYFRIKADIEPDLPATRENIAVYAKLIRQFSQERAKKTIEPDAICYLLGYSCRWTNHRLRFSAKFEVLSDVVAEAGVVAAEVGSDIIRLVDVMDVFIKRRIRNGILEDRSHREIENGVILIDTLGKRIGQINALTVLTTGDHQYGMPTRISARTYAGEEGIINIERLTDMGGPIQQKSAMILDGYLNGIFSQKQPVSCNCSLTFEQNYGEVEGDSATLAELIAIISSLSGTPVRQDIAITGSMNQFGEVQAVGGIIHKIEGYFRVCKYKGLTGAQGVIIPKSNMVNLVLRDDVTNAVREKKFFIWAVETAREAIELMLSIPVGSADEEGNYGKGTVFNAVMQQLKEYQKVIRKNKAGGVTPH